MPQKVVITLEAQDKQALARIKEFGRGVQDTVDKLKASNPALEGTRVKVSQLADAKGVAFRATQQWSGVLQVLPGQLGLVASQTSTWLGLLMGPAGLVVGLGAAATAGVLLAKSLADDVERLDNLSRQTGLSVSALESLEQAAREAGEAPESLAMGLGKVNQAIADVIAGKEGASKAFGALGVNLDALVKSGASVEDVLEATAKAIMAIEDPLRRSAAMQDLFGSRNRALQSTLETLATDGFGGLIRTMRDAGHVTDEATRNMARHFDRMADRFDRSLGAMVKRTKTWSLEIVLGFADAAAKIAEDWTRLLEFLTNPAAAGFKLGKDIAAAAVGRRAEMGERPPPQDPLPRTIGPSAAPRAAAVAAVDAPRFRRDLVALEEAEAGARLEAERLRAETAGLEKDFAAIDARLRDYVPTLTASAATTEKMTDADSRRVSVLGDVIGGTTDYARILRLGDEIGGETVDTTLRLTSGYEDLGRVSMETGEGFSILTGKLTNFDTELARGQALAEGMEGSVERLARASKTAATESLSDWQKFGVGFTGVSDRLTEAFATWESQGAMTAGTLFTTFEDVFFTAMKGNLDDFDDIWKAALDAVLRQIAAFMASAAVKGLIELGKTSFSVETDGSGGDGGFWDDVLKGLGFSQRRQTEGAEERLSLEQRTTEAAERRLVLEERVGKAVGTALGGLVGGAGGGALGPLGALAGAKVGAELLGRLGDLIGDLVADLLGFGKGITATADEVTTAAAKAAQATLSWDGLAETMDGITPTTESVTAATTDLTAAQTDLAISTADVVSASTDLTSSLGGLGAAAAAADLATTEAIAGINDAAASVGGDRGFTGADFGRGFGGEFDPSTPGGGGGAGPGAPGSDKGFSGDGTGGGPGFELRRREVAALRQEMEAVAEVTALAREAADALGLAFSNSLLSVEDLTAELTDTSAGVGIATEEAAKFVASLISGVAPTSDYVDLFQVLAQEHGPGFTDAVAEAVLQLGLSNEEAQKLLDSIKAMSEGVEVPVVYQLSTRGTPPPGAGGPPIPAGTPDGRFHGGWVGIPGFAPGGWVTEGLWDRDSVLAMLARGEFVLNSRAANYAPAFTQAFNRDPARALATVASGGGGAGDPVDHALMLEQNAILREQNRMFRELLRKTGGGGLTGDMVI